MQWRARHSCVERPAKEKEGIRWTAKRLSKKSQAAEKKSHALRRVELRKEEKTGQVGHGLQVRTAVASTGIPFPSFPHQSIQGGRLPAKSRIEARRTFSKKRCPISLPNGAFLGSSQSFLARHHSEWKGTAA